MIAERQQPLARLRWTPHDDSIADDIARLCERTGDFMPMAATIALEDDYAASLQALLADIAAARFEVHLLYYLMSTTRSATWWRDARGRGQRIAARRIAACCWTTSAPSAACVSCPRACARRGWMCGAMLAGGWPGAAARAWTCATTASWR